MKHNTDHSFVPRLLASALCLLAVLGTHGGHASQHGSSAQFDKANLSTGYSVLRLFLQDEQYLTIIRRTKAVLMFEGISEASRKLIDEIAETSDLALEQLEYRVSLKPAIEIREFAKDSIAMTTLDAMRMTTAREFLFDSDDFEKNLLVSQAQILRVISHLARELEQQESNHKRKDWLAELANRYENYYYKVYARITIKPGPGD